MYGILQYISVKPNFEKSSVVTYCQLMHDDITGWTDYVNMASR